MEPTFRLHFTADLPTNRDIIDDHLSPLAMETGEGLGHFKRLLLMY